MTRTSAPDTAGSQFFIMVDDVPHLDGQYAAFGRITDGLQTALDITDVDRDYMDKPLKPVVIKNIRVK